MNENRGKNILNTLYPRANNPSNNNNVYSNNPSNLNQNNMNINMFSSYNVPNNTAYNLQNQTPFPTNNNRGQTNQNYNNVNYASNNINNQFNQNQNNVNQQNRYQSNLTVRPQIGIKNNNFETEQFQNCRMSINNNNNNQNNMRQVFTQNSDLNYNNEQINLTNRERANTFNNKPNQNLTFNRNNPIFNQTIDNQLHRTNSSNIQVNPFENSSNEENNSEFNEDHTVFNNNINSKNSNISNGNKMVINKQNSNEINFNLNINSENYDYLDKIENFLKNVGNLNENEKTYINNNCQLLKTYILPNGNNNLISKGGNLQKANPSMNKKYYNQFYQNMVSQQYREDFIQNSNNLYKKIVLKKEFLKKFEELINKKKEENPEFISFESDESFETIKKLTGLAIISQIGQGGFSVVYEAISLQDGNIYAIKILDKIKQPLKYIKREKEINEKLRDIKFVLKFYDYIDIDENSCVFRLEKVDSNLENIVMRSDGLNEVQIWFFFSQIIEGLIKIHSNGVIHRDLKPENILLNKYEIRIADFTTSKFIYDKETDDTRLGTQGFIPPELGSKGIPNVYKYGYDIYSVGIILFFLKFKDFPDISSLDNCFDNRECSNEFKDLFFLLTLSDYKKRIAIQNVLNDPWFLKNKETFFYLTKDNSNNKYNEINFRKISEKNI